ncbi:hypothetical protein FT663_00545 [Candidozyma haemuli var. vulneris]|uniref:CAP1-binding-protein n=1 Tax=Candidozyma haemuli TaxID=45357 RepID=A0A2V1B1H7_9ASCO|nr:hypothetical protein CXQ85_004019 [[Candida] haemuloni]KAF3993271.1 hypothetical protein FT662_00651 [[Candida] haemuloni var. vulneris]KAF3995327.1 hypothetical protein FT663_00545 [[Candida] haemuloni var. vulneris]PVH23726.1 hypothetical protein CXQ85_004019 [[Candida] haemuloni]
MSDTEHDSVASDTTIEAQELEKIFEVFETAAKEAKETGDFLSYSTILDMYLSEPERYRMEERDQILGHLRKTLDADHDLVYEIGWDLPALVLPFVESNYGFDGALRNAPCVYNVCKIFEVLAHHGNSKELFLKSTELLSSLRENDARTDDDLRRKKFYDVKLYCIFELVDSCLRRIHTLYPSRFLGMTVASFINSLHGNPVADIEEADFRWKRVYSFARNYQRPPLPEKIEVSAEELEKINNDEDYLQRKLLTGFVTEAVNLVTKRTVVGYATDFFNHLQCLSRDPESEHQLELPVLDRLVELALSFDVDLTAHFREILDESNDLVDPSELVGQDDEEKHGHLFEKLVVSYQKSIVGSLVSSEAKAVHDSSAGILVLFTHAVGPTRNMSKVTVTISEAVALTLRLVVPGMIHTTFFNRGFTDVAVFWSWYAIHQASVDKRSLSLELSKIPSLILSAYFQALLFILISSRESPNLRFVVLTLLTKVLAHAPEETSYAFLIDSLNDCPYENLKTALVGVFKELVTKEKTDLCDLSRNLSETTITSSEESSKPKPPPLPKRNSSRSTRFITLTDKRIKELQDVIHKTIDRTFESEEGTTTVNKESCSTLIALLSLQHVLQKSNLVQDETDGLVKTLKEKVSNLEKSEDPTSANMAGILNISLERLSS